MSYINLGTASQLTIKVPNKNFTGWADTMRTDTFLKIAEHDHTGAGKGTQIATGAIATDAITGAKIRLDNNEYLKGRNAANNANISIIKINASDKLALGADLANLELINNVYLKFRNAADSAYIEAMKVNASNKIEFGANITSLTIVNNSYLKARNAADSADINVIKVNASDKIELGATVVSATVEALSTPSITATGSVTLTNNTAVAADAGVITLTANQFAKVVYKIVRGADVRNGVIDLEQSNATITEEYQGDTCGVTFSLASDILKYVTTNTGSNATMTYTLVKG